MSKLICIIEERIFGEKIKKKIEIDNYPFEISSSETANYKLSDHKISKKDVLIIDKKTSGSLIVFNKNNSKNVYFKENNCEEYLEEKIELNNKKYFSIGKNHIILINSDIDDKYLKFNYKNFAISIFTFLLIFTPLFMESIENYLILPIITFFLLLSISFLERTIKHIRIKRNKYKDIFYILFLFCFSYLIHNIVSLNLNNIFYSIISFIISALFLLFLLNITKGTKIITFISIGVLSSLLFFKTYIYNTEKIIENDIYVNKNLPKLKTNKESYLLKIKSFINES